MTAGFTTFPNHIIETVMPALSANGWKLFCLIWRQTAGWQKAKDYISYSQIGDATGMSSKATIAAAIKDVGRFVEVDPGVGRANSCGFDITNLLNPPENSPEIEPIAPTNGTENEPISPINGTVFGQNGTVFGRKGLETVHTKETQTKETQTKETGEAPSPGPVAIELLTICKQDYGFVTRTAKLNRQFVNTVRLLAAKQATVADVAAFETWRSAHHWTRGSVPTLAQVGEFWGEFEHWIKAGKPEKAKENNEHSKSNAQLSAGNRIQKRYNRREKREYWFDTINQCEVSAPG